MIGPPGMEVPLEAGMFVSIDEMVVVNLALFVAGIIVGWLLKGAGMLTFFWPNYRAMQAKIDRLESQLANTKADLAFRTKQYDSAFESWQEEKRTHDDTFKKLDAEVTKREECVNRLESARNERLLMKSRIAELEERAKLCDDWKASCEKMLAERQQLKDVAKLSNEMITELSFEKGRLIENVKILTANRDEHAAACSEWQTENERLKGENTVLRRDRDGLLALKNMKMASSSQVTLPSPPMDGVWILKAEKGKLGRFADTVATQVDPKRCMFARDARYGGFERCVLPPGHDGDHEWPMEKCPYHWRSITGELLRCQSPNGHSGDHMHDSAKQPEATS